MNSAWGKVTINKIKKIDEKLKNNIGKKAKVKEQGKGKDKQLVVRGRHKEDEGGRIYLHRGIAARQFQRSFVLAEGVDVGQAIMENGLLHIDLTQSVPETIIKKIKIKRV